MTKALFASDDEVYTSEQQIAPFRRHRDVLRSRMGFVFDHLLLEDALRLPAWALAGFDVVFVKVGFRTPRDEAVGLVARLRERLPAKVPLIYLDGDDDLMVQWAPVLDHVDLYVKKHVFSDPTWYERSFVGKSNLTDHIARHHGTSFADDILPSTRGVPARSIPKITVGWNIALDDKITELWEARAYARPPAKDIDVVCRASVRPGDWILPFREPVIPILEGLKPDFEVLTPSQRVSQEEYYAEMTRSRLCVSPFGYGEICWRDFEAIICGSVIVKPDVSHLRTEPDVFVPGETYIPVRHDFSDLEAVCRQYLARPDEIERIRREAFSTLEAYYEQNGFLDSVARVLSRAGVTGGHGSADGVAA